jgi:hypothetical protein
MAKIGLTIRRANSPLSVDPTMLLVAIQVIPEAHTKDNVLQKIVISIHPFFVIFDIFKSL